ncbi:MAG: dimethylarginine dimethylaminohydrolase family protein [Candidatus Bathycorpusculaceae bacterium]
MPKAEWVLVRPVPNSYDKCIRSNIERIDVSLAKKQHKEYCKALQELGLKLIWAKGDDSLPDSCFVEDTALVFGEKAVVCNMKMESRRKEIVEVAKILEKFKKIHYVKSPATIDGGDVIKIEDKAFVGLTTRTNKYAIAQLRKILENDGLEVIPVKVSGVVHLKSACTYIGNGYVLLSEGHFNEEILKGYNKLIVPEGEAYAANCLAVNGTVLMAKGYPKTRNLIEKGGFTVKELEMSEFRKGEGALTCLSIIW